MNFRRQEKVEKMSYLVVTKSPVSCLVVLKSLVSCLLSRCLDMNLQVEFACNFLQLVPVGRQLGHLDVDRSTDSGAQIGGAKGEEAEPVVVRERNPLFDVVDGAHQATVDLRKYKLVLLERQNWLTRLFSASAKKVNIIWFFKSAMQMVCMIPQESFSSIKIPKHLLTSGPVSRNFWKCDFTISCF